MCFDARVPCPERGWPVVRRASGGAAWVALLGVALAALGATEPRPARADDRQGTPPATASETTPSTTTATTRTQAPAETLAARLTALEKTVTALTAGATEGEAAELRALLRVATQALEEARALKDAQARRGAKPPAGGGDAARAGRLEVVADAALSALDMKIRRREVARLVDAAKRKNADLEKRLHDLQAALRAARAGEP